jgi:hypothetical protein
MSNGLHGVTPQKTALFISGGVRTWAPRPYSKWPHRPDLTPTPTPTPTSRYRPSVPSTTAAHQPVSLFQSASADGGMLRNVGELGVPSHIAHGCPRVQHTACIQTVRVGRQLHHPAVLTATQPHSLTASQASFHISSAILPISFCYFRRVTTFTCTHAHTHTHATLACWSW